MQLQLQASAQRLRLRSALCALRDRAADKLHSKSVGTISRKTSDSTDKYSG
jgi:hypothetical protein